MKRNFLTAIALVAAFGLGVLINCGHAHDTMLEVEAVGKIDVQVPQGSTIKWYGENGGAVGVTFAPVTPCSTSGSVSTCTVTGADGYYKYACPNCVDPGISVGSSTGIQQQSNNKALIVGGPPGNPAIVGIYCDTNHNVQVEPETAKAGDNFEWQGLAGLKGWTVNVQPGTCTNPPSGPSPNGPNSVLCTVAAGAQSQPQYTVTAPCTGQTTGKGSLTITP